MKTLLIIFSLALLSPLGFADDKPKNLDELLELVKKERTVEKNINEERETAFIEKRDEQASLLEQAREQLAFAQTHSDNLQQQFEQNETHLAEQQKLLQDRSGSLGELFGTFRLVANDAKAIMASSVTSIQHPDRQQALEALTESKQQPSIEQLHQLWVLLQQEMTESGKVDTFDAAIIESDGEVQEEEVTRIGLFTVFSEEDFLRYIPETGNLVELTRQSVSRLREINEDFEDSEQGELSDVVIDPTRGAILSLLVQKPTLYERVMQGGWIGIIILLLGVIGLVIAAVQFAFLLLADKGISKQQQDETADTGNALGRILSVYSQSLADDVETLTLKLDEAILREIPRFERGLTTLAILAAVTPMLGLLGTVSGMIETFQSITLFGTGDPKLMSGGISQALVTTELGLAVAIPLLLIHSGMSAKSNRIIQILDEESASIVATKAEQHHGHAVA